MEPVSAFRGDHPAVAGREVPGADEEGHISPEMEKHRPAPVLFVIPQRLPRGGKSIVEAITAGFRRFRY